MKSTQGTVHKRSQICIWNIIIRTNPIYVYHREDLEHHEKTKQS